MIEPKHPIVKPDPVITPYAVLWRYDFDSSESLARENTMDVVKQVYPWAEHHIDLIAKGSEN